jgi:anti-sigma factor NepR-like protein
MNDHNKPTGPKGPMAGSMQGAGQTKRKSSLNRETQIKIGKQLEITYNEVVNQGVPDRFVELIRRLEGEAGKDPGNGMMAGGFEGTKDATGEKGS